MESNEIEYEWRYCPECDEEYLLLENDTNCVICGCDIDIQATGNPNALVETVEQKYSVICAACGQPLEHEMVEDSPIPGGAKMLVAKFGPCNCRGK